MEVVGVDLWTFDVGAEASSPEAYAELMTSRVLTSWEEGADLVLFPEFAWMGLERFVEGASKLQGVAELFWEKLWPDLQAKLNRSGKAVVLGTVPYFTDKEITNRAPIIVEGKAHYQDKLNLTPWETAFTGGEALHIIEIAGLRFAVIVCLDIEIPEISVVLRGAGVDLILVPSATETVLGTERVGRCASARAVELGCYVGVAHLVGKTVSELVDENVGRLSWFTPSQSVFSDEKMTQMTELLDGGFYRERLYVDISRLQNMRKKIAETNPALLTIRATTLKARR